MNEHIEIEYKILLTQKTFQNILHDYQKNLTREYTQTNYYFTHPLLQQKKYMLRIREKNNTYELTLKRPIKNHRLETNVILSQEDKECFFQHLPLSNEIIDILQEENIDYTQLTQEFSLTTHRYDFELKEGTLSLDHSTYLNQEDYELEFEVNDEHLGYEKFLKLIQPYSLNYSKNCSSKIQRVIQASKNCT